MQENLIIIGLVFYLILVPLWCNLEWSTSENNRGKTFLKWYFTKSESVNYLGFAVFLIIGSGSFVYYIFIGLSNIIVYVVILPLCWIFEFLFLNKDCSNIICDELKEKETHETIK